jgi:hypothetical protein
MTGATPALTVIPGGRNQATVVMLPLADVQDLHLELYVQREENLGCRDAMRDVLRLAMRALGERSPATGMWLVELERLNEQEAARALNARVVRSEGLCGACTSGRRHAGHGPSDSDALAVPVAVAA